VNKLGPGLRREGHFQRILTAVLGFDFIPTSEVAAGKDSSDQLLEISKMPNTLKLTEAMLRKIDTLNKKGVTKVKIAKSLGIARNTVYEGLSKIDKQGLPIDPNNPLLKKW
jgi:hypothetical protein